MIRNCGLVAATSPTPNLKSPSPCKTSPPAAETASQLKPSLDLLKQHGIGAILDYAAEDDVKTEDGPASRSEPHDTVVARTFDYDNESKCDQHTSTFLKNIQAASDAPGQGFAAIKVTPPPFSPLQTRSCHRFVVGRPHGRLG